MDGSLTVTGHDLPEDVQATYFTSNAFNFFGVLPVLGRGPRGVGCDRRSGPAASGRAGMLWQVLANGGTSTRILRFWERHRS